MKYIANGHVMINIENANTVEIVFTGDGHYTIKAFFAEDDYDGNSIFGGSLDECELVYFQIKNFITSDEKLFIAHEVNNA